MELEGRSGRRTPPPTYSQLGGLETGRARQRVEQVKWGETCYVVAACLASGIFTLALLVYLREESRSREYMKETLQATKNLNRSGLCSLLSKILANVTGS